MRFRHIVCAAVCLCAFSAAGSAVEERYANELSCRPVNGYVNLPGIKYDDLTPLARDVFRSNPAAVSKALYALPAAEREDFITLYLEPAARERHRYFFARCREYALRQSLGAPENGEVLPAALRQELRQREEVRLSLQQGALPFRVGPRTIFIPAPDRYKLDDGPLGVYLRETGVVDNLAVFGKTQTASQIEADERPVLASVQVVREASDSLDAMLQAYRTMVDADWRITALHPEGAPQDQAEMIDYKWNLQPFFIRDHSFCYGQFEKTSDIHGVSHVKYRATAVIMLPGCFIQVSILRSANTGLDQVDEINSDLAAWRDAILAANWQYVDGR